jgi:hypothetical protein
MKWLQKIQDVIFHEEYQLGFGLFIGLITGGGPLLYKSFLVTKSPKV